MDELSESGLHRQAAFSGIDTRWHGAADVAKQKNLNVMETLSEAGLQGSEALAKASTHTYSQSFQQALKNGATFDQALKQATADTAMETITWRVPLKDLLDDIKGDPKKARTEIDKALKRDGIYMTPLELQWLGAVAAEASFLQYDSNFYKKIALEMMTGMDYETAHAVASRKAWQEAAREMSVIEMPDRVSNAGETFGETQINSQELQQEYMEFNEDIEANEEIDNPEEYDTIDSRGMAMSLRKPRLHILTEEEIQSVLSEARALEIDENLLRFNQGSNTGFSDKLVRINIKGDVLPDTSGKSARDRMSIRAVLAHEYYGHYLHHPSEYPIGDWRDEFRASYEAAVKAPNLTAEERRDLMIDAYDRAKEAGAFDGYDETARRIIYGY